MFIFTTIVAIAAIILQSILIIVPVVLIAVAPLSAFVISSVPDAARLKMNVLRQMLRIAPFRNAIIPERRERRIVHVQCRHARSER